jgi:predicted DNA-binding transcriptional regulator YafY
MLETSARLLRLLSLLQTPREWTGTQLAERLGVSTRTVRNDVERLRSLGYPVDATRGAIGGYRLGAGAQLPPLLLDDEEAVAVAVGLRTASSGSVTGIEETSLRALAKLEQVLPSRLRRRVNALQTYVVPVPSNATGPRVDAQVLTELTAACRDHQTLRFDYESHDKSASRRAVEPYSLVNWGRRWYLVAWDLAREDWRIFRVDRITPRLPTGPRFTRRELPDEDLGRYVSARVSAAPWRVRAQVTVHAPAAVIAERVPAYVGPIQAIDDETCVLSTGNDNAEFLAVYLGMIGADFTVTDPPELVAAIRTLAERYGRAAQGGGAEREPGYQAHPAPGRGMLLDRNFLVDEAEVDALPVAYDPGTHVDGDGEHVHRAHVDERGRFVHRVEVVRQPFVEVEPEQPDGDDAGRRDDGHAEELDPAGRRRGPQVRLTERQDDDGEGAEQVRHGDD